MTDLISKWVVVDMLTALENDFQQFKPFHGFEHAMYRKLCEVEIAIGKMSAITPEELRPQGKWIDISEPNTPAWDKLFRCSKCGKIVVYYNFTFCPNCGAKMEG